MRVWPKDETARKLIKHPTAGAFREIGGADWPDDAFTFRRVRDGDLLTKAPSEPKSKKIDPNIMYPSKKE